MQKIPRKKYILVLAASAVLFLAILLCTLPLSRGAGSSTVSGGEHPLRISEVMSRNTAYPNGDGVLCDWIEIQNTSGRDFNISGYRLTDKITEAKFGFPSGTVIPAGGYIVVWCTDQKTGGLYAPFKLAKTGGEILQLQNSANIVLDEVETLRCPRNYSLIRCEDGTFTVSAQPTPGFDNTAEGYTAFLAASGAGTGSLRISEIMPGAKLYKAPNGESCDWIEIENCGTAAEDLSGMHLSDKEGEAKFTFAEGTVLQPGASLVVWCGSAGEGGLYAPFKLDKSGEGIIFTDASGAAMDRVRYSYLGDDISYARVSGEWTVCATPTPGYPNTPEGFAAFVSSMGYGNTGIILTEICDKNTAGLTDYQGDCTDWIEIYNSGSESVNLKDWYLSDSEEKLARWAFPDVTLAPDGYLVVRASGKNRTEGELHTDFSLSTGETVYVVTPIGTVADSVSLPLLEENQSFARMEDGSWKIVDEPTPGNANKGGGL